MPDIRESWTVAEQIINAAKNGLITVDEARDWLDVTTHGSSRKEFVTGPKKYVPPTRQRVLSEDIARKLTEFVLAKMPDLRLSCRYEPDAYSILVSIGGTVVGWINDEAILPFPPNQRDVAIYERLAAIVGDGLDREPTEPKASAKVVRFRRALAIGGLKEK